MKRIRAQSFSFEMRREFWGSYIIPTLEEKIEGFQGPNAFSNMPTHQFEITGKYQGADINIQVRNVSSRTRPRTEVTVRCPEGYEEIAPKIAETLSDNYGLKQL